MKRIAASIWSTVKKYRTVFVAGGVLVIGLVVFVAIWFQPQKLFLENTVIESSPTTSEAAVDTPLRLASGPFRSLEHRTVGTAVVVRLPDGSSVLRLEGLDTSNGPDLRVYLSEIPPDRGWHDYGERFVDLGALKGNRGSHNYAVPPGVDVSRFRSAVIWCRRFTVGFGVAPLTPA